MNARERVEMTARETVEVMVRTSRGSMTVWSASEVRDAIDALESAVAARTREQVAREIEAHPAPPADFFQPDHTYTRRDGTTFRCDAVTTHPTSGWLLALGWHTDTADWILLAHQGVDQWNHEYDQNGEQR